MKTLVIAPHPDDEVLGVGGTLLRRKEEGVDIGWLIVTKMSIENGWSSAKVDQRNREIVEITKLFRFNSVFQLDFNPTLLDQVPMKDLVDSISEVILKFSPTEIFVPHPSDIHSDHRVTFEAVASCAKWFRSPTVKRILAYETLSETDFSLALAQKFNPNFYINIEKYLQEKIKAMTIYQSEIGAFPFPRSNEAIVALATLRGASSGFKAAEAFELLKEIN